MADIRYNNSFSLAGGFNITNAEPIDSRMYVADIQHIYLAENWVKVKPYPGLIVAAPDGQVRICINSDYTKESSWKKIGGGNVSVETLAEAQELAVEDNIGQVIFVSGESVAYIVSGAGVLMKLATSTAGDIDSIVAAIQKDVLALQSTVGDDKSGLVKAVADNAAAIAELQKIDHDAYVDADAALKEELEDKIDAKVDATTYEQKVGAIDAALEKKAEASVVSELAGVVAGKVDSVEGSRLMTDAEGTKLAGVAAGAQVNVIETVKVNGNALDITDKSVNIEIEAIRVKGVDSADKMLSLSENGEVKSELSIKYVKAEESADGKAHIALFGKGGTTLIDSIDATDFVKDGMIDSVELKDTVEGTKVLEITWNTDAGKEVVNVPVSSLIDYYYAGNGLKLDDSERKFSIDLKEGEEILTVDAAGLGINTSALWGAADTKYDAKGAAGTAEQNAKDYADGLDKAMSDRVDALEADTHKHDNKTILDGISAEKVAAWDAAEQNAKDYADGTFVTKEGFNEFEAEFEEKLNGIAAGAQVNVIEAVKVNGIEATIENKVASVEVKADDIKLGVAITDEPKYDADSKVSTVLQGIFDAIKVAEEGAVNTVSAADATVEVDSTDKHNPTVKVKVSAEADNLLAVKEDGLFVAMYYDGDDAE